MRTLLITLVAAFALGCGESRDSNVDAGLDAGVCAGEPLLCCVGGCGSDAVTPATCADGTWTCSEGAVLATQCAGGCGSLPGPPSSLRPCADSDAGLCLDACDPGQICFTQVSCSPLPDGGGQCTWGASPDAGGDDRCHRICGEGTPCGSGELCTQARFFACTDFDGTGDGRFVCR